MRIALLHPTYWPEVRRGSERLVHDLATWLTGAGHDVTVLTTHRARGETAHEGGFRVVRAWRPPDPLFERRAYEAYLGAAASQAWTLTRERVDVAQAFAPVSGWAALRARRDGMPVVFSHMGIPTREYLVRSRYRLPMHVELAREASACTVLSQVAAEAFSRYLLREPEVIPPGVACADFEVETDRTGEPTIVYAGSATDPRKRLPLLIEAFRVLRRRNPGTRLWLAGKREPLEFELPEGVEWVPGDRTNDLARALAAAHVAVLPSIREGFGLVLVEALAAGTPVVAAASGAAAEIVTPTVGRLFEPDDRDALVTALTEVLELDVAPDACRTHARRWDWSVIGPRYESLLAQAAA